MENSIKNLIDKLVTSAAQSGKQIDVTQRGQITANVSSAIASGSLAYYLGDHTSYFQDAGNFSDIPVFVAFLAISLLATTSLRNICGKRSKTTIFTSILGGGVSGFGVAGVITALAFGLLGDLLTFGGFTITGCVVGYLIKRRGAKRHATCDTKLPCDTWICTKCKHIINPSRSWTTKDQWNILDVCDYLDTGGLEMDAIQALCFLDYSRLLDTGIATSGFPALWAPEKIKRIAKPGKKLTAFASLWQKFASPNGAYTEASDLSVVPKLFSEWTIFLRLQRDTPKNNKDVTKGQNGA